MLNNGDFVITGNGNIYQALLIDGEWILCNCASAGWIHFDFKNNYGYHPVKVYRAKNNGYYNCPRFFLECHNSRTTLLYYYKEYLIEPIKYDAVLTKDGLYYKNSVPLTTTEPFDGKILRYYFGFKTVAELLNNFALKAGYGSDVNYTLTEVVHEDNA